VGKRGMGFHHGLSGELASPDLDVSSARLRSFRPEPRRTAHRERLAARGQRRASVSPASERDRIPLAQFDGRGVVCASSHQRRVRRLGSRTQERIEHAVLSARAVGVWLVRAQTGTRPLHRGCWVLRALLLAKPQAITFPFLLLLWDYWPLDRMGAPDKSAQSGSVPRFSLPTLLLEKVPLLLLSAASAVATMVVQSAGHAVKDLARFSLPSRMETTIVSYERYLGKAFWPAKLVAPYPHPLHLYPAWEVGAAVVLLLLITAVALRARDKRYLAVGWLWFLAAWCR